MQKIDTTQLKQWISDAREELARTSDPIEINRIAERLVTRVVDAEFASLWIFDPERAVLVRERDDGTPRELSMLGQQGILAKSFLTMSSGIYNYLASEKGYVPEVDNPDQIRIKSKLIVPILDGERFLGLVTAYNSVRHIQNFDEEDRALLEALVPFLRDLIYLMRPDLRNGEPDIYIGERLKENTQAVIETAKAIEEREKRSKDVSETNAACGDEMLMFLANTVHDIRTPANTLYGFLELLESELSESPLLPYVKNAKQSAEFINTLTTSILDRIGSGMKQHEEKIGEEINPIKFFAEIAESFSANMYDKHIAYTVYIDPKLPKRIKTDATKLKRIVMNLLNNAYKFTPEYRTIDFSVVYDKKADRLRVAVSDTGIGIAEEKQKEIFESFRQAEADTKEKYGGTGLGLSIVASYVKELGGSLTLESELEKGSTFRFDIPLEVIEEESPFGPISANRIRVGLLHAKENLPSARNIARYLVRFGVDKRDIVVLKKADDLKKADLTHLVCFKKMLDERILAEAKRLRLPLLVLHEEFLTVDEAYAEYNVSRYSYYGDKLYEFVSRHHMPRVLIVDDDAINIELIKAILSDEFCRVDTAESGEDALEMMSTALDERYPYTVVFLDKHMSGISGAEMLRQYREVEKQYKFPPVYAVSISGDVSEGGDALFDAYIGKPFTKSRIKEALSSALQRSEY